MQGINFKPSAYRSLFQPKCVEEHCLTYLEFFTPGLEMIQVGHISSSRIGIGVKNILVDKSTFSLHPKTSGPRNFGKLTLSLHLKCFIKAWGDGRVERLLFIIVTIWLY